VPGLADNKTRQMFVIRLVIPLGEAGRPQKPLKSGD
tara:strand:- start:249 stop:356 length:108 start_codon:yes stop_codon:yes gene_type:complete